MRRVAGVCAPAFDADLLELAERRLAADSVVWDVGANVGTFSVAAAAVFALFARHGYAAFDPANDFGDDRPLAACIENTLFVPRAAPA